MLRNSTKKVKLDIEIRVLGSRWSQGIGLIGKSRVPRAMIFKFPSERLVSLHMLLVFTSIDVIFLSKSRRIVELKKNLRPFSFYFSKKQAMYAIELPIKSIDRLKAAVRDRINWD